MYCKNWCGGENPTRGAKKCIAKIGAGVKIPALPTGRLPGEQRFGVANDPLI